MAGPLIKRIEIIDRVSRKEKREIIISEDFKVINSRDHIEPKESREREKRDVSIK